MSNKIIGVVIAIMIAAAASGCGRGSGTEDVELETANNDVKEVQNFSSYEEPVVVTNTPVPTQAPTNTPVPTATPIPEISFEKQYDLSDYTVLSGAYKSLGGLSNAEYTTTVEQDHKKNERIQTTEGEGLIITLTADKTSGSTNRIAEITVDSGEADVVLNDVVRAVLPDLTEEQYAKILNGGYNGKNAGYIGLSDLDVKKDSIKIVNPSSEEGDVPYWSTSSLKDMKIGLFNINFSNESGIFKDMIKGLSFNDVSLDSCGITKDIITKDKSGNVIDSTVEYEEKYKSEAGNWTVKVKPSKKVEFSIQKKDIPDGSVYAYSEYLLQYFFHEEIADRPEVSSEVKGDHYVIKKTDDGYSVTIG